ncbi:hypothetical protein GGX14DRAFT_594039, partial [Mycena pura]
MSKSRPGHCLRRRGRWEGVSAMAGEGHAGDGMPMPALNAHAHARHAKFKLRLAGHARTELIDISTYLYNSHLPAIILHPKFSVLWYIFSSKAHLTNPLAMKKLNWAGKFQDRCVVIGTVRSYGPSAPAPLASHIVFFAGSRRPARRAELGRRHRRRRHPRSELATTGDVEEDDVEALRLSIILPEVLPTVPEVLTVPEVPLAEVLLALLTGLLDGSVSTVTTA